MEHIFKIGDKVRCIRNDGLNKKVLEGLIGTVVDVDSYSVGVDFDYDIEGHACAGAARMGHGWYLPDTYVEYIGRVNEYNKVLITIEGNTTIATLMKGRLVLDTAKAKCSPDDRFDPLVGAQIAIQRLAKKRGSKLVLNGEIFTNNIEVING